ncbi:MAG: hypothetical protein WCK15_09005, partial [Pirellula sp.]
VALPEYRARGARSKDVGEDEASTPMPLSNTPSHNLLKQQAGQRGIAVGASLTCTVYQHRQPSGGTSAQQLTVA